MSGLAHEDATCPGCQTMLTAAMFTDTSVRPPDVAATATADEPAVLAGWDEAPAGPGADAEVVDLARWRRDRQQFPVDAAVLAGGGVAGAAVGWLVVRDRRGLGAALGAFAGLGAAAVSRQIWRLPE